MSTNGNRATHASIQLEARVAARLAACLSAQADAVPHDISERLRVAREQALARARAARRAEAAAWSVVGHSGSSAALTWRGAPEWWMKLASLLPLVVLAAGLLLIEYQDERAQIAVAAEVDAALLADDLPPSAYRDPGFAEYLRQTESH